MYREYTYTCKECEIALEEYLQIKEETTQHLKSSAEHLQLKVSVLEESFSAAVVARDTMASSWLYMVEQQQHQHKVEKEKGKKQGKKLEIQEEKHDKQYVQSQNTT